MKVSIHTKQNIPAVAIHTEFIKLQDFLKFCDLVPSGGMAKNVVVDGLVSVNGEVCTMRGKKLYPGDVISYNGASRKVSHAD